MDKVLEYNNNYVNRYYLKKRGLELDSGFFNSTVKASEKEIEDIKTESNENEPDASKGKQKTEIINNHIEDHSFLKNDDNFNQNRNLEDFKEKKPKIPKKKKKKEKESKLEFPLYIFLWIVYFTAGFWLPLSLGSIYVERIMIPLFLNAYVAGGIRVYPSFWYQFAHPVQVTMQFVPILTNPLNLIVFLTIPLVFLGLYLLRMMCVALIVKFYYWLLNTIRPRKEMVNSPPRGETADDVNIYHTRGFVLRIIKWTFSKSPFPWLTTWMLNFIGSNKIGKNVVFEEHILAQEYLEMADNTYIGPMSIVSSHIVEGQYGALTVKKVRVGKNSVIGAFNLVPPGTEMGDNCQILPLSATLKFQTLKAKGNYWGLPISKMSKTRYKKFIQLPQELEEKSDKKKDSNNSIESNV